MAYIIIFLGILFRLLPHLPNMTPILAIALFGGVYLNKKQAIWLPIAIMAISDVFIGMHPLVLFTWGAMALASFIGLWLREHKTIGNTILSTLLGSFLFFVITNFGVWAMPEGWYPHTLSGFISCYVMALPFFRNALAGDLLYVGVLFGVYEFAMFGIKKLAYSSK